MNANQINYKIGFARGLSGAELPFAAVVNNPVLDAGFRMGRHVMFKRIPSDHANINKINWMTGFKVGKAGGHLTMEQALNDAALSGYNTGRLQPTTIALERFMAPALNGFNHRSQVTSPVKKVWAIAESHYAQLQPGQTLSRKSVIIACVNAGIATHTARTQYQRWYTSKKVS